jgi:hypothetical protein
MVLQTGEKLHVVTRRLFESDLKRHFAGEVVAISENLARLSGYAFIFDAWANMYVKRPERRERIIPLTDSGLILTVIPEEVDWRSCSTRCRGRTA